MSQALIDVTILKKRFPGKYDHIDSGLVPVSAEELRAMIPPDSHTAQPEPKPKLEAPARQGGPGTELKALLKDWLGITASPNCSCNARARQMDEWGPDVCERNLPTILGWLEEQAKARGLPFVRIAATQAVRLAIRRARKKAAK